MSDQPVAPSSGLTVSTLVGGVPLPSRLAMICQVVPTVASPWREGFDLLGVVGPVLADHRSLLLEQRDGGVELLLIERVRVRDPQVGLRLHQDDRRVGDVDRRVIDGDLASEGLAGIEHGGPVGRRRVHEIRAPHQQVGAAAMRDAVVDAIERVPGLVLERRDDVGIVGYEIGVHGLDIAARRQPLGGVARKRR